MHPASPTGTSAISQTTAWFLRTTALLSALVAVVGTDRVRTWWTSSGPAACCVIVPPPATVRKWYTKLPQGLADRFRFDAASFLWGCCPASLCSGYEACAVGAPRVSAFDWAVLAEPAMAVERHLRRVAARLPQTAAELLPATDASDAVILHLWQATQIVIDLAMSACLAMNLGTPSSYPDAFRRLHGAGVYRDHAELTDRLARAAGFRNVVAHAYDTLDMRRVHAAATNGRQTCCAFLARLRDRAPAE